jgi:hypothetical protein
VQFGFGVGFGATMMETWHVLATAHAAPEDAGALLALNAFCYFALAYGYFGFVNLNLTSLRIRILAEILECGGELPTSELFARYGMDHVATIRMRRLIAGRHLLERNGRIYNDRRLLLFVARVIRVLQIAILGSDPAAGEVANRDMGG